MVTKWSLDGMPFDIGLQNVQKILFVADKGQSHKTSRSHIRGSSSQGLLCFLIVFFKFFLDC